MRVVFVGVMAAATLGAVLATQAAPSWTSRYTKLVLENCALERPPSEEGADGGLFRCRGEGDIDVFVAEGDLRMYVSFGPTGQDEPAMSQTFPQFNRVHETLEWVLQDGMPVATILRWFPQISESGAEGSVLVVTQLGAGRTCHIAYVDAQANRNANELARQAAQTYTGRFDCSANPVLIGAAGPALDGMR